MKTIDLRSDTVTQPTEEMRQAMYKAEVGDDVYGEDPSASRLEEMAAKITGKEAALFVASGTMGNLIALLTHCQRGEEVIAGDGSHISLFEQRGASALGGISLRTVPNLPNGQLSIDSVKNTINPVDIHFARTKLICIENTWNGHPLPFTYMENLSQVVHTNKLKLHLDGARIFNAAIALQTPIAKLVEHAHSVQMCFSKGLSAPVGSIICADPAFISEARRVRKMLGGGVRQIGIIAAACMVGLDKMIDRLAEDHQNAKLLADALLQLPGIEVQPAELRTNMVFFRVLLSGISDLDLAVRLKDMGVLLTPFGAAGIRAVTHYGITAADIKDAVSRIKEVLSELPSK